VGSAPSGDLQPVTPTVRRAARAASQTPRAHVVLEKSLDRGGLEPGLLAVLNLLALADVDGGDHDFPLPKNVIPAPIVGRPGLSGMTVRAAKCSRTKECAAGTLRAAGDLS
jgi:hypothetical protein